MHTTHRVSLVALVALAACQDRITAVAPPPPPAVVEPPAVMSVTGSATIEVGPDCADLTMTIAVEDARPSGATRQVNKHKTEMIALLAKHDVTAADLKLSLVTLAPIYAPREPIPRVIGYRAAITITATTRDFSAISDLMEVASDAGATEISSQFRRSDLPELKKRVRDMALTAAKDKARQITSALGIDLGRVVAVTEGAGGSLWSSAYFPSNAVEHVPAAAAPSVVGGTSQTISLDVTVGYQLGHKA